MAARQGSSAVENIIQPQANPVIPPEVNAVEDSERLQNSEKSQPNDENQQLAVLDAIQQLSANMASMKHDLARLDPLKKKRKGHDSSDDTIVLIGRNCP